MAQLVKWKISNLKEVGSNPAWCFWRCRCRIRWIRSSVNLRQLCRTQRQAERRAAWPGTAPPPPLYLLAGVTRGAYLYGLYHFAFLECAFPGVNQRPQFGQCGPNICQHFENNIGTAACTGWDSDWLYRVDSDWHPLCLAVSNQCCGSGMFIPDPDFLPIPDHRSLIPDPKTATKEGG